MSDHKGYEADSRHIANLNSIRDNINNLTLEEVEHLLELLSGFSDEALFYIHLPTQKHWWSRYWREILGYSEEEMPATRENWKALVHPDDVDYVFREVSRQMETQDLQPLDYRLKTRNQGYRYFRSQRLFMEHEGSTPRLVIGKLTDISDLKLAQESVRLSSMIIDNMAEGVMLSRRDGDIIVYANPKYEEIFGYEPGELIGKHGSVLNAPSDQDPLQVLTAITDSINETGAWKGEVFNVKKDGTEFWTKALVTTFEHYKFGEVLLIVQEEITDIKQSQHALQESENNLKKAQALAHIGHCRINLDNDEFYASEEVCRIFGIEYGSDWKKFNVCLPPDEIDRIEQAYTESIKLIRETTIRHKIVTPDGKVKWINTIFEPVTGADGKVREILATAQDISKLVRLENELQNVQRLKSLGVLAGGIAHDFNNIHTILFGNIAMAKSELSPQHPSFEILEQAENAYLRANNLTKKLLTFARGGEPIKTSIRVDRLVSNFLHKEENRSKLNYLINNEAGEPVIDGDKKQLEQVLENLVSNAVEAMPDGGNLHISIEKSHAPDDSRFNLPQGEYVLLKVRDEGHGIEPDILPSIFDPYFSTRKSNVGLGLAIIFSIINKHGGQVIVDSTPQVGTSFSLYFPAGRISENIDKTPNESSISGPAKPRILVMDDEDGIAALTKKMLEKNNHDVDCVGDGELAVRYFREAKEAGKSYDCLIMDLTVPGGMGGQEAMEEILKIDADAKAIVASGYANDTVMSNFREYGFTDVITKPFTLRNLNSTVKKVLQKD